MNASLVEVSFPKCLKVHFNAIVNSMKSQPTLFSGYQGILLETSSIKLNLHGCLCEAASDYAFIFLEW